MHTNISPKGDIDYVGINHTLHTISTALNKGKGVTTSFEIHSKFKLFFIRLFNAIFRKDHRSDLDKATLVDNLIRYIDPKVEDQIIRPEFIEKVQNIIDQLCQASRYKDTKKILEEKNSAFRVIAKKNLYEKTKRLVDDILASKPLARDEFEKKNNALQRYQNCARNKDGLAKLEYNGLVLDIDESIKKFKYEYLTSLLNKPFQDFHVANQSESQIQSIKLQYADMIENLKREESSESKKILSLVEKWNLKLHQWESNDVGLFPYFYNYRQISDLEAALDQYYEEHKSQLEIKGDNVPPLREKWDIKKRSLVDYQKNLIAYIMDHLHIISYQLSKPINKSAVEQCRSDLKRLERQFGVLKNIDDHKKLAESIRNLFDKIDLISKQ